MSSDPSQDLRRLIEDEEHRSHSPRRRRLQFLSLAIPLATTAALLLLVAIFRGPGMVGALLLLAVKVFFVLGKFAIWLGVGGDAPFSPWEIAAVVAFMDTVVAAVLVYNLPRVYRIKGMGPRLEELADHGHYMVEQRPWLRRMTLLGVVAFVMFPLTGTGAIGGSIFGRLLGLGAKRTLLGIMVGAVAGCALMAAFADTLATLLPVEVRNSWQFQVAGVVVLVAVVGLIWHRGRKVSRQIQARKAAREDGST